MEVAAAVRAIESTVIASQGAIARYFDGPIANAQLRAELEGIWQALKVISSAIDADGVNVRGPIYLPSRETLEGIVARAAQLAAEEAASRTSKRRKK
ncbi:hypothetical protein [Leucobacter iarius]|uniref:Uncharacterized protein n=1 Tax=Leucobacter iarius TaxID=333963 RepID=A0ABN2LJG9_9MICO